MLNFSLLFHHETRYVSYIDGVAVGKSLSSFGVSLVWAKSAAVETGCPAASVEVLLLDIKLIQSTGLIFCKGGFEVARQVCSREYVEDGSVFVFDVDWDRMGRTHFG